MINVIGFLVTFSHPGHGDSNPRTLGNLHSWAYNRLALKFNEKRITVLVNLLMLYVVNFRKVANG
jgi:hypothetical protein